MFEYRDGSLHVESVPQESVLIRNSGGTRTVYHYDVEGPVCEYSDFLGKSRERPEAFFAMEQVLR